ncbi:hypothetical protein Pla110_14970 [Polystyrenella longa]|uniref:PHP domain protein n=1 Tax=Polystyrenella longa TaxID=2528007 RepID=A0A518CKN0_9PLAN|nr:hypothetical protein [Polystyrenella longa]QDU79783.1 hypothetical protein Pla110_14970 [Polystyrenella longa]
MRITVLTLALVAMFNVTFTLSGLQAGDLEAKNGKQWFKGNLHAHSLWSDGDEYPEMIGLWYKEQGYNFLTLSDHNVLATIDRWIDVEMSKGGMEAFAKLQKQFPQDWIEQRKVDDILEVKLKKFDEFSELLNEEGSFLMVKGEEVTDGYKNSPIHMNVSNVKEMIPPMKGKSIFDTMQNNVNAAASQRERTGQAMMIHLNHPNFHYGVTAEDLMRVIGENFFEVYNGHPGVRNNGDEVHASTERMWDIILTRRITELKLPLMYGLATDDGHEYHHIPSPAKRSEPGRGWVMVLADKLDSNTLITAIEQGDFYASSGVTMNRIVSNEEGVTVEVEPVEGETYTIEFIGTRDGYDTTSEPVLNKEGEEANITHKYSDELGTVLHSVSGTEAHYSFQPDDLYVRVQVTSSADHANPSQSGDKKQAWIQPVYGPAGQAQVVK